MLFGHHYASIAGLSPMLGPAIAVIWGWLPAMLWVVFGTIFIGAVHDMGALVVSIRARGMSIGKVAEEIIGARAKTLFHLITFFLIALAMGVFVYVVGLLFTEAYYPEAVLPTFSLMAVAMVIGFLIYKRGFRVGRLTAVAFAVTLVLVWAGVWLPISGLSSGQWMVVLLVYGFFASVLPVWLLLQPRDYVNSLLLYLGLGSMYLGLLVLRPEFAAPAVQMNPEGAPSFFPFVFIVIACGAASGFHGLVASGTTAKQLDRETDARFIGYAGMIGESLLGLIAVVACTAGFASYVEWSIHYANWDAAAGLGPKMGAFIEGTARFIEALGVPIGLAKTFVAVIAVSFALTSLDSATRLLRYNISEVGETLKQPLLGNRYLASALAVGAIGFFAFFKVDGRAAGLALWELFGTTNQILVALTLLSVSIYLMKRRRNFWIALLPMAFMLVSTVSAMLGKIQDFWEGQSFVLLAVGGVILVLSLWVLLEGVLCVVRWAKGGAGGGGAVGKPADEAL